MPNKGVAAHLSEALKDIVSKGPYSKTKLG